MNKYVWLSALVLHSHIRSHLLYILPSLFCDLSSVTFVFYAAAPILSLNILQLFIFILRGDYLPRNNLKNFLKFLALISLQSLSWESR